MRGIFKINTVAINPKRCKYLEINQINYVLLFSAKTCLREMSVISCSFEKVATGGSRQAVSVGASLGGTA